MSGRHRRGGASKGSLAVALLVLAAAVGGLVLWRNTDRGDPGRSAAAAEPEPSREAPASPAASPAASPSESPSPDPTPTEEPKGTLVIHAAGDTNLDPSYIPNFRTYGYAWAWTGLHGLFRRDDLTIVNLECAVSDLGFAQAKEFTFRGDPKALPAMADAGVEVANMGNNHSQDFGVDAMLDTRRNLMQAGVAPVGAGRDLAQATEPAFFEANGWKIAVLGFGGVVPTPAWLAGGDHPGMASGDDISMMVRAVRRADRQADLVIVAIHWGVELDTYPRQEDIQRAHAMIDAGADMIFGGHAHRLQPMIEYKGKPVFYSLGNFVWPSSSVAGSTTGVAEVIVRPNGSIKARFLPAYIEQSGHPVLR